MAKLGDICTVNMGQSPDSATYNEIGRGLPFFQGNADFGRLHPAVRVWCSEPTKIAHTGDILISVRAPIGAMNVADQDCCIGRGLAAIQVNENICDPQYLWYAIQSKVSDLNAKGTGSTFKAISKSTLTDTEILLVPLDAQKNIARILSNVENSILFRKEQLSKLDELVKARFVEMFGGINDSKLYPYSTIDSFTTVTSGGTPDRSISEYWIDGSIRWVKTTELQNRLISDTEEHITQAGLDNSSAKIIPTDSILIAMYGQGKTRGMTAYLSSECATNQACACILPSKVVNQKFLWHYMILSYNKLRDMAKGGNQLNLNIGLIKQFPVLIPPLSLQNQFADFVAEVDKSKLFAELFAQSTCILAENRSK